jgi:hypothetical protein
LVEKVLGGQVPARIGLWHQPALWFLLRKTGAVSFTLFRLFRHDAGRFHNKSTEGAVFAADNTFHPFNCIVWEASTNEAGDFTL